MVVAIILRWWTDSQKCKHTHTLKHYFLFFLFEHTNTHKQRTTFLLLLLHPPWEFEWCCTDTTTFLLNTPTTTTTNIKLTKHQWKTLSNYLCVHSHTNYITTLFINPIVGCWLCDTNRLSYFFPMRRRRQLHTSTQPVQSRTYIVFFFFFYFTLIFQIDIFFLLGFAQSVCANGAWDARQLLQWFFFYYFYSPCSIESGGRTTIYYREICVCVVCVLFSLFSSIVTFVCDFIGKSSHF